MTAVFRWRERESGEGKRYGVDWAITDRLGGVSVTPYATLNLGAYVGDDPVAVGANRRRVGEAFALPPDGLRFMHQQHGTTVCWVGAGAVTDASPEPMVDALLTDRTDIALTVLIADCTPVLLLDRTEGMVSAVHAGRQGMTRGVVTAAVAAMRERGAADLEAVVGPSVCARCYEVPEHLRAQAAQVSAAAHAVSWTGTPAIDVAAGVVEQLASAGVAVRWLPGCSREDAGLFSHRRDGRGGRNAGVVRLLPPEDGA